MSHPARQHTIRAAARHALALLAIVVLVHVFAPRGTAAELDVSATLTPKSFSTDEGARLTITVSGSRSAELALPETDTADYEIIQRGRSSQINIVNGEFSAAITFTCLVRGYQPGQYTLPPITVSADGQTQTTDPIQFVVTDPRQGGGSGAGAAPQQPADPDSGQDRIAFLALKLDRREGYVGEILPVQVKAYFRKGLRASLNGAPTLSGDGLIMGQLTDKPVQTEELVGGSRYTVLTWQTSLSNIKEGVHRVQLGLDATLLIPERRSSRSFFGQSPFFDDDFFDSVFGGYREKPLTARSEPITFTSLPLPDEGRPASFAGAIGDFNLQVSATPIEAEAGEPLTLTMTITGNGNFDRVQAPLFPESADWKTYSPSSDTTAPATASQEGRKVFEQAIVARSAGITEIPALSFSYFDPVAKRYVSRESMPIPVTIKGPVSVTAPPAPIQQSGQTAPAAAPPQAQSAPHALTPAIPGLAPLHLSPGKGVSTITPVYYRPVFLVPVALLLLALGALSALHLLRRHRLAHPEREEARRREKMLQEAFTGMEDTLATGDSAAFLAGCRTTIQGHLARLWNCRAEAITRADLLERLGRDNPLVDIFTAAEQSAYSGVRLDQPTMRSYATTVKAELEKLS